MTAVPTHSMDRPLLQRGPIRHRNYFRWRVMPPEEAGKHGFFDRSFESKKAALKYQKRVKARFANQPCCIIDMGRWYDSMGRTIH